MPDPVGKEKHELLAARMLHLGIRESDLNETFILGSGSGGQKLNKTASCVRLHHAPSGLDIKCQSSRSRETNRFLARRELCDRLEERLLGDAARKRQEAEKIRRQKRRRSRRQKARMLDDKRRHAEKKNRRRTVTGQGE